MTPPSNIANNNKSYGRCDVLGCDVVFASRGCVNIISIKYYKRYLDFDDGNSKIGLDAHYQCSFPLLPLKYVSSSTNLCPDHRVTLAAARGLRLGDVTEYK